MLYFAYGSNLLSTRLRERTPNARPYCRAQLPGYDLRFHKCGADGSGKCDAFAADSSDLVEGVVLRIPDDEIAILDAAEGVGHGYRRVSAKLIADGADLSAEIYRATAVDSTLKPWDWYRALVVAGAIEQGLPPVYVAWLRTVETVTDPDRERAERHFALIAPQLRAFIDTDGAGAV